MKAHGEIVLSLPVLVLFIVALPLQVQEHGVAPIFSHMKGVQFGPLTGVPAPDCVTGAILQGDPSRGAMTLLARFTDGCTVPWHWHTPNEHVLMVRGVGRVQMKGGVPFVQRVGDYTFLPGRHIHYFTCASGPCILFAASDGPFDIHYANEAGEEIPPQEALKASKQPKPNPRKH